MIRRAVAAPGDVARLGPRETRQPERGERLAFRGGEAGQGDGMALLRAPPLEKRGPDRAHLEKAGAPEGFLGGQGRGDGPRRVGGRIEPRAGFGQRAGRVAPAVAQVRQPHRTGGGGDDQRGGVTDQHLARRAGAVHRLGPAHQPDGAVLCDLGAAQRVAVIAVVERAHHRRDLGAAARDVEHRRVFRAVGAAVMAARCRVLRLAFDLAPFQHLREVGKALQRDGEAAGVERERGFLGRHVEHPLQQDVALVDARSHPVPGDPVAARALEQRPDRRVEAGVTGQGAVVEIDPAVTRAGQHRLGHEREIGDAQKPVRLDPRQPRGEVAARCLDAESLGPRPVRQRRVPGHDYLKPVPALAPEPGAFQRQRVVADQYRGKRHCAVSRLSCRPGPRPSPPFRPLTTRHAAPRSEAISCRRKPGGSAGGVRWIRRRSRQISPPAT